jgi:predicted transcriptional regulator
MVLFLGSHRRSEVEILCNILETCLGGAAKTSIVYKANLNFTRLNRYVNMLLGMGYISLSVVCGHGDNGDMRIVYRATEQGRSFLANFQSMQQGLEKLSGRNSALAGPLISRSR